MSWLSFWASLSLCSSIVSGAVKGTASEYRKAVEPFLAKHCILCHNDKVKTHGLSFDPYKDPKTALKAEAVWDGVLKKLNTGQMPPKGLPQPKPEDVRPVTAWIETVLARAERSHPAEPGRLTAHRLNRFEYNNAIHDLLGVDFRPAADFPTDDSGYGFDNIGDVLSLSPVLMDKYLAAAERIASQSAAALYAFVRHIVTTGEPPTGKNGC